MKTSIIKSIAIAIALTAFSAQASTCKVKINNNFVMVNTTTNVQIRGKVNMRLPTCQLGEHTYDGYKNGIYYYTISAILKTATSDDISINYPG